MFVSHISHELRTPLAALIGELEITLFKERTVAEYQQTIENILADSRKLVRLSAGMLDLAKASYDVQQISMKEVRLDEILLDAFEVVNRANPEYVVQMLFEQEPDDENCLTANGNEYLLRTTFVNLIENNCKFSANHTSHVRIAFLAKYTVIRFADTGIGLPPEDIENLFTPPFTGVVTKAMHRETASAWRW